MNDLKKHLREYITDAGPILEKLKIQVEACRTETPGDDILDEIFRHLHSLKSGAAFFQLSEIEQHIHSMESLFADMKSAGGTRQFSAMSDRLYQGLPLLEDLILYRVLNSDGGSQEGESLFPDKALSEPKQGETIDLTLFEKQLLREAEDRGETLFRLCVQIDPEERLPYVRSYLLLNNLELHANVIRSQPSLDNPDQDFSSLTFILTSDAGDDPVFQAVNVDGILQTSLVSLDYSVFSDEDRGEARYSETLIKESLAPVIRKVELETDTISRLKDTLLEMKEIVLPLPSGLPQRVPLLGLIKEMEENLNTVSLIPLTSLYPNLKRFIEEAAVGINKKVVTEFRGGLFGLKIRTLEIVSRILIQLIRNAVSHGIEFPAERLAAGKSEAGLILIDARAVGDSFRIDVSDDGHGIDLEAVAGKLNMNAEDLKDENLLRILTRPGFTTSPKVDRLAGRGIGLDLVNHDVENSLGGSFSLTSRKGQGSRFSIYLPGQKDLLPLMIFQMENRLLALPKRNVAGVFPMEESEIVKKEHNLLYYKLSGSELPLFSPGGMLSRRQSSINTPYILVLQHLGRKAALAVDDLVMEKEVPRENFFLGEQKEPFLYEVTLSGEKADFLYLSPGLIG
ncbi:ATP-binding protein [Oceanispirochaeta sp.]|uniref:ATP-binding protein n=1 Tax=Oceanispirochaeta sp. TaxID=2035350 RepID=UPI0026253EF0|nr:ATP-binding protein [Oceanispirochaeta sp.]MDA3957844.1 ATP-binding protein [Oceanispirochaeta sp.]